jgi:two-component system response regulator DegU
MHKIKIYLADDHALFRKCFARLLTAFNRIGEIKEAGDGNELLNLVKKEIPDLVVLDLEMPVMNGIETCQKLVRDFPKVKILIVSSHNSKQNIAHLLKLGAHAFLHKNSDVNEVRDAIYSLFDSGYYRNELMAEALKESDSFYSVNITPKFSPREQMIIELICMEYSNKLISKELSISENTVRNHKVRIMRKTGVKNTAGLVKFAFEHNLTKKTGFH